MKRLFTIVFCALLMVCGLQAQQIKGDFNVQNVFDTKKGGIIPDGWSASNVTQNIIFTLKFPLVFGDTDRSVPEGKSVKMVNTFCGTGTIGSNAPAYITLGTPWVYADIANAGKPEDTSDGGTYGGQEFAFRPDSLVGWIKRSHGTEEGKTEEVAKIITYLWKGTSSSVVKTGTSAKPVQSDLNDREKDILGLNTEGVTGDAQLIASADYTIEGDIAEWTRVSIPLEYALKNSIIPEKANVIISSADYYNRPNIGKDNTLWADDFSFVYNSKLQSITLDGVDLDGFDTDLFLYENLSKVNGRFPTVAVSADGIGAKVDMELREADSEIVITVTGDDGGDNVHTYTLRFTPDEQVAAGPQINGDFESQEEWEGLPEGGFIPGYGNGVIPNGWGASNVIQLGTLKYALINKEESGYSGNAVRITNRYCGAFGIGSNAPGYITLGLPWVYADMIGLMATMPGYEGEPDTDDSDGGSVGGIAFTYQPDSIVGFYKRTYGTEKPTEDAKIFAYLWKGNSVATMAPATAMYDVTGTAMQLLIDRDIDILGTKNEGVPAAGVTLIATAEETINTSLSDWTRISVPMEYKSDEKPEKANVIISSADYFNRQNIGKDNVLSADEVAFIYNSKLESITLDGVALSDFDKDVYTYTALNSVNGEIPVIVANADGKGATVEQTNPSVGKVVITVKGNDYSTNESNIHTYTLEFKGVVSVNSLKEDKLNVYYTNGKLNIEGNLSENTVEIYTVQGQKVAQFSGSETIIPVNLVGNSIYIVRIGNYATRIFVK